MGNQTEIKESPSSEIRPKLEQIQRRSTRKRSAPKYEQVEEMEDIVVDDVEPVVVPKVVIDTEEDEVEFTRGFTNKGSICIWYNGYRYIKFGHRGYKHYDTYWRCSNRRCSAKAFALEQEDGKIIGGLKSTHNHLPQPEQRLAEIKRQELKQRAREDPTLSGASLVASIRSGCDDETFVALGSDASLARLAQREKIKLYGKFTPKKDSDIVSIVLPLTLTERNGQSIFLYDSRIARARDKDAVFVFAHPYMLQQLAGQTTWTIGASFKLAPSPFKYSFVIGTIVRGQLIVAAHALLTENSESFYMEAMDAVAGPVKPTKPRRIITDFENTMVLAAQKVFPEAHISGCYFRFAQELFKKWSEYNLGVIYGNEKSQAGNIARMTFRRLICLALIPMAYVNRAFYKIVEGARLAQLAEFFFYFKQTFIGLTDQEFRMKAAAFGSNFGQNLIYSGPEEEHVYEETTVGYQDYTQQHIRYEMPPPPTHSSPTIIVTTNQTPPFLQPLRHRPYCPLEFWNISERVATELINANCAMEVAQLQIKQANNKQLSSLPNWILSFWDDFEKQRDNIRSQVVSNKKRNQRKHVIKEDLVVNTLNEASYETDQAILNTLDMLSHHVQGYVNGLYFDIKNEKGQIQQQLQQAGGDDSLEFNESLNSSNIINSNSSGGVGGGRMKPSTSSSAFR
uniref:FLYWCH-type domain-containing protein n=1 Tax=Meloidogyne incognita TaxID=6306 RepID=A0A914ND54_MELIC